MNQEIQKEEDINPQQKELINPEVIPLSKKMRWIVFLFIISITIFMGLDQGILSSSTSELMKDFEMTERELGGFGGMVFLGNSIGCICAFAIISKINRKLLLLGSMILDVLCLLLTTQTKNLILLYSYRVIAGIVQSFLSIYSPVWSDQFGIHKYKSIMISLIHISSSIGYLIGFVFGYLFIWEHAFYIQNLILIIHIVILILFLPDKYFSMSLLPLKAKLQNELNIKKENDENIKEREMNNIINEIEDVNIRINDIDQINANPLINNKKEENEIITENENGESFFEDIQINNEDLTKESFLTYFKIIIKSPIYILMNITLTCIFLVASSIQFWINDYMENGLLITDKKTRLLSFTAVAITSPPLGIILGGILAGKLGGYDTENAIYIPIIASFIVSILANIAPLTIKLQYFLPLFWTYLFLGCILLPVARGIVLVSVDKKYNGPINSISTLIYNVIGKLPGPNLYAFFKSKFDKNSRIPFWLLLNVAVPGFISSFICLKYQKEKYRKLKVISNKKDQNLNDGKNDEIQKDNKNEINEEI